MLGGLVIRTEWLGGWLLDQDAWRASYQNRMVGGGNKMKIIMVQLSDQDG
jgi:hypothetical protein